MGEFNGKDRELLHDIDRRVAGIQATVRSMKERLDRMDNDLVSKEAFKPVARVVYGLSGTILAAVVGALMWVILK